MAEEKAEEKSRADYMREWRKQNPEKSRSATSKWRKNNPEKVKEYNHKQYLRRKEANQAENE